jgi:hypothetical protein
VLKSVAPKTIDFIGDKTRTRGLTDALKPSANGLDLGVNQISGGRLVKGSPAMKERMAMLRGMRKVGAGHNIKMDMDMHGANVFNNIRNGFNRTFTLALGKDIKKALTSPVVKYIYKGIIDVTAPAIGIATGTLIVSGIASQAANKLIDGMSIKRRKSGKKNTMVGPKGPTHSDEPYYEPSPDTSDWRLFPIRGRFLFIPRRVQGRNGYVIERKRLQRKTRHIIRRRFINCTKEKHVYIINLISFIKMI